MTVQKDWVMEQKPEGKIDPLAEGSLGLTEELDERTFLDITYADDRNADQAYVERALAGDPQPYLREKRYIHKNGSLVWVNLITTLVRDATGAPLFFISVII